MAEQIKLEDLIKTAANPHLIASAKQSNELLAKLQSHITDLRGEVSELELKADLHLNELLQTGEAIERQKAKWRVSAIYQEWRTKKGLLSDLRAIRRNLERHTDLLIQQEKFTPRNHFPSGGF